MILSDTLSAHLPERPTAVALGFFDGIHRGHTKVISAAVQAARQQGLIPCVFTFSPPGKGGPKPVGELIQTDEVKQYILERMGVRQIFRPPFEEFRDLTPEEIAEKRKHKAPAYRVRVPDENVRFVDGCMGPHTENLLRDCGDFYLRRADGVFAYQLAVVVDDARMGVTEVVRGADLLSSTARQLYLYRLLGLKAPRFAHCPLLLAPDGRRLSKRDGDQSLENLRARYTAEEIVGRLAYVYGLQPEPAPRTPESLITDFSWENVPKEDICLPENLF